MSDRSQTRVPSGFGKNMLSDLLPTKSLKQKSKFIQKHNKKNKKQYVKARATKDDDEEESDYNSEIDNENS